MLSRNDHKQHHDTPVFTACDDGFGTSLFGTVRILFGLVGGYQICQYPTPFACMRRNRCCCRRDIESGLVFG